MARQNPKPKPQEPRFNTDHDAMAAVRASTGTDNNDDAVAAVEEAMGAGYTGQEGGEQGQEQK